MRLVHFHGVLLLKQKYENFDYFAPNYFVLEYFIKISYSVFEI